MQNSPEKMFPAGNDLCPVSGPSYICVVPTIKIQDSRTLSHAHTGCTVKCGNAYETTRKQAIKATFKEIEQKVCVKTLEIDL